MRKTLVSVSTMLLLAACSAPDPMVVPDRPLPEAFENGGGDTVAKLPWQEFFTDEALRSLIAEAVGGNLDLLAAAQRIEIARAAVRASGGALLPQVAATASAGVRRYGQYTAEWAGNSTTEIRPGQVVPEVLPDYSVGLTASWEVDLFGRLRNQRRAALAGHLAAVEGTHAVLASLVSEVAATYYELLAVDLARDVVARAVEQREAALEIVRLQKEAGRGTELAVQQFEAELFDTRGLATALEQEIVEVENRINLLLGRYPRPVPRSTNALFAPPPSVGSGIPSALLENRPDVREAEQRLRAAEFDVAAARAAFFPSIVLTADVGYQAFDPRFLFSTPESITYGIAGGLVAPLINRAGLEATFSAASAVQLQALYEYQKAILTAYTEVVDALSNLDTARELLGRKEEQKAALLQTVETADLLYRAAKATYLDVLLAQEATLEADLELIEAQRRERLATVQIYKALGGGWR
ncbi:efflux transporter outer membrane subunit [Vulgatibacter sp.]|uniref:efflux transporter outer membrane subunit n=1 Tax=Vulgatibacter sp. TaxID=1971226 RepID=UPI0035631DEB